MSPAPSLVLLWLLQVDPYKPYRNLDLKRDLKSKQVFQVEPEATELLSSRTLSLNPPRVNMQGVM